MSLLPPTHKFLVSTVVVIILYTGAAAGADGILQLFNYRLCVPSGSKAQCDQMVSDLSHENGKITCITASGKIGCIERIIKDEADFIPLEPEEIFVAHRFRRNAFTIIAEIRSEEFKTRDYRYEPVAVIRKSSGINSISDLRGKKSCHTGFGRNAGWKIPFSHLLDKNELPELCNEINAPAPEKDLYAISKYFSEACAPGPWVPEKDYDATLRSRYPNLCQLCKNPRECNGNDVYAGYEGALKCLTENNGDVAWTKMDAVEKYFKLNSSSPSPIARDYAFLCWDGSSQPLTSKTCSWGKRPWRAYLASNRLSYESIGELQKQISFYKARAQELRVTSPSLDWDVKVLEINSTSEFEFVNLTHSKTPSEYLREKNYSVTIEKSSCPATKLVRICVKNVIERMKCLELQVAAVGKRIIPGFDCVLAANTSHCFTKVQNGDADAVITSAKEAAVAKMNYGLIPILNALEVIDEASLEKAPYKFTVAVIRADSKIQNLTDLEGKKSCHGSIRTMSGWNIPLSVLRTAGLISGPTCGLPLELGKFFNGSCVPGIFAAQEKMPWLPDSLCHICSGDTSPGESQLPSPDSVCQDSPAERYFGNGGALRCLADQVADVAFIDHVGLLKDSTGIIDVGELRLLCPQGQVMEVSQFRHCNWGKVPSTQVLSRDGDLNQIDRENTRLSLLKAGEAFSGGGSVLMPLFGPYYTNKNLMFQDNSVGLVYSVQDLKSDELIAAFDFCQTSSASIPTFSFYIFLTGTFLIVRFFS